MSTTLNYFEETTIKNHKLPSEWQSQEALDGLLAFLQSNWEQRTSLFDDGQTTTSQQYLQFTGQKGIRTQNYVGTIVFRGQKLNIFPKVFREDYYDEDTSELDLKHLMHNLVLWLEYCNKMDYPYINISAELGENDDLKELFITLYIKYLEAAFDRGMFYKYEDVVEDCKTIKGKPNIKDYLVNKYPNGTQDKFECEFSTFEIDNLFNRIIKYVCKSILNETSVTNQKHLRRIIMKLNDVSDVRCVPSDCDKIRLNYLQRRYKVILSLSKMFLINKTTTYDLDKADSFCFLFPTEILFEGFIGGFMQSALASEANVRLQASEMSVFSDVIYKGKSQGKALRMKHDILVEHKEKGLFILDTKYKRIERFEEARNITDIVNSEVKSGDVYQLLTYARTRGAKDVYLLYPLFRLEEIEPSSPVGINRKEDGTEPINVHFVRLPFVFEDDVETTKSKLKSVIESIFE